MLRLVARSARAASARARWFATSSAGPFVTINGVPASAGAVVSVHDESFLRGTGVFEVVGVAESRLVGLDEHILRLLSSMEATGIDKEPLVRAASAWMADDGAASGPDWAVGALGEDEALLFEWVRWLLCQAAGPSPDGAVPAARWSSLRLVVTRGTPLAADPAGRAPRITVIRTELSPSLDLQRMPEVSLLVLPAPWHLAGRSCSPEWGEYVRAGGDGSGALKWLSYGPNIRSSGIAARAGATDALLVGRTRAGAQVVLEGPTFAVAWEQAEEGGGDPSWVTPCPVRNDLLPSVTAAVAAAACERHGIPFGTRRGPATPAGAAAAVDRGTAWRRGQWAYGAEPTAEALLRRRDEGMSGRAPLWTTLAGATAGAALSSAKHVSPVSSVLFPASMLAAAAAEEADACARLRERCEAEGPMLRLRLPGRPAAMASAYAQHVAATAWPTDPAERG